MFVFSEQHARNCDDAVQQILVFPHAGAKAAFETEMAKRRKHLHPAITADGDAGAIYKLISDGNTEDGGYIAVILCGNKGTFLWKSTTHYLTPESALAAAMQKIGDTVKLAANSKFLELCMTAGPEQTTPLAVRGNCIALDRPLMPAINQINIKHHIPDEEGTIIIEATNNNDPGTTRSAAITLADPDYYEEVCKLVHSSELLKEARYTENLTCDLLELILKDARDEANNTIALRKC